MQEIKTNRYCRECGNELLNTDKFCYNCGTKIIKNIENLDNNKNTIIQECNSIKPSHLPMTWYNFFTYFKLPLNILIHIALFFTYDYTSFFYDKINLGVFFLNLGFTTLFCATFYMLHKRLKNTMRAIVTSLAIESLYLMTLFNNHSIESSAVIFTYSVFAFAITASWFILNYNYFKKRKEIFVNKLD